MLALDCEIVGTVADGGTVLEAVQRLQPDVIVLDLHLPDINGLEACRLKQRSFENGASAFVYKGHGDLLSTVKRLCDDGVD